MVDIDYSENLHHIHLWATQQEWFRQIQSTLFILMAYFINPNTGVLEIMTFAFFTPDLDHTVVGFSIDMHIGLHSIFLSVHFIS